LQPRGIISIDLFGLPADYTRDNAIVMKYGLFVIEDAAQSFDAEVKGEKVGCLANIGCPRFSQPSHLAVVVMVMEECVSLMTMKKRKYYVR